MPENNQQRGAFYARIGGPASNSEPPNRRAARALLGIDPRHAGQHGWVLTQYVFDIGSGLRIGPGLQALLDNAHAGLLDLIVVDHLASLGRTAPLLGNVLCEFSLAGTSLYALSDAPSGLVNYTASTSQAHARLLAAITAAAD